MTWKIQQPLDELQSLLRDLGVYDVPALFGLSEIVSPVSIVDSRISLVATISPILWSNVVSAGILTNPAASTILADTGPLAAGSYDFKILLAWMDATTSICTIDHRDAANAANIWSQAIRQGNASDHHYSELEIALVLAESERVRVFVASATGAAGVYSANIFFKVR